MKKIMIIAAVVMAVVGAKAAAIDWTASAAFDAWTTAETGKNTPANGWLGYVVLSSDYSAVAAALEAGDTSVLTSKAVGPVKNASTKGAFAAGTASGSVAAGEQAFRLIVFNNANLEDATAFAASGETTAVIDAELVSLVAFGSMANATKSVDSWTAMAPEPTSGLLLLIGCAGLALRRRRA